MSSNDTPSGARRALTTDELDRIVAAVDAAGNTRALLNDALGGVFDALLCDRGTTLAELDPTHPLTPGEFAVPTVQWNAIVTAILDRAAEWGTAAQLTFDLVNLMPASYDDPTVPAPTLTRTDRRPPVHQVHLTRDAVDVIAACEAHIGALAAHYGPGSQIHLDALTSWHRHLAGVFGMGMGADTHVSRDGDLSLLVTTASRIVYGLIFHGTARRCTTDGCHASLRDDGTCEPDRDDAGGDHEHIPSYPIGSPRPGTWSFHS